MNLQLRRLYVAAILSASLALSACASSIKEQAVKGVQVSHESVGAAQDGEISIFASGLAAERLTPERHKAFHAALVRYFDAEDKVLTGLKAWRSGEPVPKDLPSALNALTEAIAVLSQAGPSGLSAALQPLMQAVNEIQRVVALLGGKQS